MSYNHQLEYLRKEFKKSEAKFLEAEREGWHTDADVYEDNMENLEYQIHIHEQAAKAGEYEDKAKAFDRTMEYLGTELKKLNDKISGFPYVDQPIENTIGHFEHVLEMMKNYERGEQE